MRGGCLYDPCTSALQTTNNSELLASCYGNLPLLCHVESPLSTSTALLYLPTYLIFRFHTSSSSNRRTKLYILSISTPLSTANKP